MWYWLGFGEMHLSSGWKPETVSEKSFKKQMKGSSTGPEHGPCKWGVRIRLFAHGSAARTVQERSGSARVSCTDRVREINLARVFNTGRVREACNFHLPHTGRADQHGPCWLFGLHGSCWFSTGHVREAYKSYLPHTGAQHGPCQGSGTGLGWFCKGVSSLFSARGVRIGTGHSRFCTGLASFARVVQFSLLLR